MSPALIAAAGGSSILDWYEGRRAQRLALQESQRSRDWQERMSNTAWQRSMHDLEKAGLNPILVGKMGGASTPTGATAQVKQPQMSNFMDNLQRSQTYQLLKAQTEETNAKTKEIDQRTGTDYWKNTSDKLLKENRKLDTQATLNNVIKENWKIKNSLEKWTYEYFKSERGYPPQVLWSTAENGIKTDIWHNIGKNEKTKILENVNKLVAKINNEFDDFSKDPGQWLKANASPLVGMIGLQVMSQMLKGNIKVNIPNFPGLKNKRKTKHKPTYNKNTGFLNIPRK